MKPIFEIIAETSDFWIVDKPGGILTQAPPGIDSLELRLRQWQTSQTGELRPYVGVPHRLDRPVSGVMVFSKKPKTTQRLGEQFQSREVEKFYWALVGGEISEDSGTWTDTMRKVPDEPRSEIVPPEHPDAQAAILHFQVLARASGLSLLQINLETGRTHQIRLQCAARNCPIFGDSQYGSTVEFGPATVDLRARVIGLHARSLSFFDHRQGQRVEFVAKLPDYWNRPLLNLPEFVEIG
ncbi:MAG: RNA pseudouridine synthase [Pirellulaceae bacterium]|nr:RNA pseudouridine synthase [Pirellulaceae bacterium]